ncbi:MAG: cell division protein FtsQ [Bacteroidaceae bacterium]|nr:cell division protein FtsQ [Bacteroidaceae bacterium]
MKTAIKIFLLLAVVGYLVVAIWKFSGQAEDRTCEGVRVEIIDSIPDGFITGEYVRSILTRNKLSPEGMKISDINLEKIEQLMLEESHIERASCYYDAAGKLCIKVVPQQPILHVISQKGEDYYLSSTGLSMPTASFNVDLCVATGNITKKFASEHLLELARYIHDDLFWSEQIEQIYVVSPEEIRLYPRVGQHIIELGNSDNFQEKLNRLRIFYREGLERVGWNKYQMISLAYDGQVVCTKANNKKNK